MKKIDDFCAALNDFDKTIKTIDTWMKNADGQVIWDNFLCAKINEKLFNFFLPLAEPHQE